MVRAREHLSNSTLARDCANDDIVPSVWLVAVFQPQWLTHRLASTVHCEESVPLSAGLLSLPPTHHLPAPPPAQACTPLHTLSALWLEEWRLSWSLPTPVSHYLVSIDLKTIAQSHNFPVIFSFSTWEVDSVPVPALSGGDCKSPSPWSLKSCLGAQGALYWDVGLGKI